MPHPYYPPSAHIAGFAPNVSPLWQLLPLFGAVLTPVVAGAYRLSRGQALLDRLAAAWFALCGFLHVAFEGYYVVNRSSIAASQAVPAQLWKEYALSDSRYLTLDVFTVCVETLTTLILGPLCCFCLVAILCNWPARHALQSIVCTMHLYGVALYYATSLAEDVSYSRPEPLYFWLYYVGFNAPWVFVPLLLLRDSYSQIKAAFKTAGLKPKSS
ncbi:hypothetical protein CDD81_6571 [Ophiocordyceps australis]|uniref:EXPERA domain-containing protein n=1 Tax=Ophiocordyceps australis TaxID=1399860 RepID=A0A2C5XHL7_9HYPO|nr:hypothetical protein CDD81_6571 [Ophiocordyceps australis]